MSVVVNGTYVIPTESQSLCYNGDPRKPIDNESYEYTRVHKRLPKSSGFEDGNEYDHDGRCYCFRSLTEEEIDKAIPVEKLTEDKCQYYSIRCLRKVELGDVPSCAESYFRCKEQKDVDGISNTRATALRAELCQRFEDIDTMYADAIQAVKDVDTSNEFTLEDKADKLKALEKDREKFKTRREVSCEGKKDKKKIEDPQNPTVN
ncbi:hypothetical protein BGZ72_007913 [Mortierella alpina]|nr:hypothetical protein BGZ72_007913 [Mortierella alpina]